MARRLFNFMVVAMMATLVVSCSEEQTSLSIEDIPGKAKVMGFVTYDSGATGSGINVQNNRMLPASGKTIYVEIDNDSFKAGAEGVTTYETVTDANGKFEIEIPAVQSTFITIKAAGFEGTQKKLVSNEATGGNTLTSVEGFFSTAHVRSSVSANETIVENISYYDFTPYAN